MTTNQVLDPVQLTIGVAPQETVTLAPADASGKSDPLFSVPSYIVTPSDSTSPPFDGATVPASDGLSAKIQASGTAIGTYNLLISAEGDKVAGVNTLTVTQVITIVSAEDTGLNPSTSGAQAIG